jgi:nucleotide-binding universal stress UspA family protein
MSTATPQTQKIVVGVDMSATGDHALRAAMGLLRGMQSGELHATYVIRVDQGTSGAKKVDELAEKLRTALGSLRDHIAKVCAPPRGEAPFTQETVLHVRLGKPAQALHQVAVDVDADIVVVGSHGRKGVEKMMLGSVAEELVRIARLPVLVAHPKDLAALEPTPRVEPPRPGEDIHERHGLTDRLHLELVPRTSHISGLL